MNSDNIKVVRVLEYWGPREWVEKTLTSSAIRPSLHDTSPNTYKDRGIREVYVSREVTDEIRTSEGT